MTTWRKSLFNALSTALIVGLMVGLCLEIAKWILTTWQWIIAHA